MKQITENTILIQGDKRYTAVQIWREELQEFTDDIVWIKSKPISEETPDVYPKVVVEKLRSGKYMLWQVDSVNDTDVFNQYEIVAMTRKVEGVPLIQIEEKISVLEDLIQTIEKNAVDNHATITHVSLWAKAWREEAEENPAQYTKEDMSNLWQFVTDAAKEIMLGGYRIIDFDEYIKSLNSIKEIEEEIEVKAEHSSERQEAIYTPQHKITYKHGFIDGYKANTAQYTEKDMRKAYDAGMHFNEENSTQFVLPDDNKWRWGNFLKSLNSIKEIEVDEQFKVLRYE